ncbi:hypothetical protein QQF64_029169 [Cirrhinus molitorella]|uniref:NADH dehydrogenase subunit 4 n=1 Tax=Cirrhinus molitorella TaxID=172907 RepID=A0ABR3N8X5_9TELE
MVHMQPIIGFYESHPLPLVAVLLLPVFSRSMSIIYLWTVKFAGTSRPHLNLQQLRGLRLLSIPVLCSSPRSHEAQRKRLATTRASSVLFSIIHVGYPMHR